MPSFRKFNQGLTTDSLGCNLSFVTVAIGATGAVGTINDFGGNTFASVVRVSAGLYRFTLNSPYPGNAGDIAVFPSLAMATPATSAKEIWYDVGTYNPATGSFDVQVTDRAATPAAADPANGDSIHILLVGQRYKNL